VIENLAPIRQAEVEVFLNTLIPATASDDHGSIVQLASQFVEGLPEGPDNKQRLNERLGDFAQQALRGSAS